MSLPRGKRSPGSWYDASTAVVRTALQGKFSRPDAEVSRVTPILWCVIGFGFWGICGATKGSNGMAGGTVALGFGRRRQNMGIGNPPGGRMFSPCGFFVDLEI